VWVGGSIVAKPRLDALTTLAYVAGNTSRVRLGTAVLLPALRHPVVLAHQLANVDQISRGRLVVGVVVGWGLPSAEREWAACGMDHKRRARRLEEHIEIWRMLWRGEPVTHSGHGVELVDHTIGPLPWTGWATASSRRTSTPTSAGGCATTPPPPSCPAAAPARASRSAGTRPFASTTTWRAPSSAAAPPSVR
jgi:alkanesulfonate monooxygenase SsuD/methylene tetrahydromethanopterin reductase-like flavin-dependent oxidoreductase (luciferase family)